MSRRPRVPGTPGRRAVRIEVATGGNPVDALIRASAALPFRPAGVWSIAVHHDTGCPATPFGPMAACTCEIVELVARRAA